MRVVDALHEAETLLRNARVTETPRLDSEVLLADVLGVDRARLIASHLGLLAGPERTRYFSHVLRRSQGEPVAYSPPQRFQDCRTDPGFWLPRSVPKLLPGQRISVESRGRTGGFVKYEHGS